MRSLDPQGFMALGSAALTDHGPVKKMNLLVQLFQSMQRSRQLQAERVIRRHWHLVEQARAHERRRRRSEAAAGSCPELVSEGVERGALAER